MLLKQTINAMRKNLLIFSSFLLTFVLTFVFSVYLFNYLQQKEAGAPISYSLLQQPWHLQGNKSFIVKTLSLDPTRFSKIDTLLISYNLHGLCMLGDSASEIMLEDMTGTFHGISLTKFGKNCFKGQQTITIPITSFSDSRNTKFIKLEVSFWYPAEYAVDITKIIGYNNAFGLQENQKLLSPIAISPTVSPIVNRVATVSSTLATPAAATNFHPSWAIQSVSSMKDSKDKVCNQRSQAFIEKFVDTAKDLGANYVAVETPYDNPSCGGNAVAYAKLWASVVHSAGLHVWHRHSFTSFEGIYGAKKDPNKNYVQMIADYIQANPDEFTPGDIFTPIPEPQNGGISGVTYCPESTCIFSSAKSFNQWLRNAMDTSQSAFSNIGLQGKISIGYFGFDGFVTWGNNNPQWSGILENATIAKMGNITIDHYPEAVGDTMAQDLQKLTKKYPKTPIIIGEWGTISGGNTVKQVNNSMGAALADKNIVGFNYWQMSAGGNESLINEDFSQTPTFGAVQSFYKSTK